MHERGRDIEPAAHAPENVLTGRREASLSPKSSSSCTARARASAAEAPRSRRGDLEVLARA